MCGGAIISDFIPTHGGRSGIHHQGPSDDDLWPRRRSQLSHHHHHKEPADVVFPDAFVDAVAFIAAGEARRLSEELQAFETYMKFLEIPYMEGGIAGDIAAAEQPTSALELNLNCNPYMEAASLHIAAREWGGRHPLGDLQRRASMALSDSPSTRPTETPS